MLLLAAGGAGAAAGGLAYSGGPRGLSVVTRQAQALGTRVSLTVRHRQVDAAERAIEAAFAELALVERLMSIYQPESQLSRLNRQGELAQPHPQLVAVLAAAAQLSAASGGAFDVTVQPLWEAFSAAQKASRLPTEAEIAAARARVDWRGMQISHDHLQLRPGMRITLNGIAQGFAADRLSAALRSHGVEHALIDAGELSAVGRSPREGAWRVGIQHPRHKDAYIALADLDGRALATSGDYATKFSADGHYNHIVDPRSGCSPTEVASVSVVAPTATEADALSTAMFVLGPDAGLALAARRRSVDVFIVLKSGETIAAGGFPLCEGSAA
jgi:thiamine biosynthesis lipoprotein